MEYSFKHFDSDTHKNTNYTKDYIKSFNTEEESFNYLAQTNESQSFCYGQKDYFNDLEVRSRYDNWRSALTVSAYKNIIN